MRPLAKFKIIIDVLMTAGLLLSMSHLLIGQTFHEYNGAILLLLFIVHNVLNRKWYKALFRGRYTAVRILQTAVNILTLAAMFGAMISGIVLSQEVFGFIEITGFTAFARTMHLVSVYWGFVLMSMHLGLHWSMIFGMIKKSMGKKTMTKPVLWLVRAAALFVAVYGVQAFMKHNLWSYMSLQVQFVFFDTEKPLLAFFTDYISIMCALCCVTHYLKYALGSVKGLRSKKRGSS